MTAIDPIGAALFASAFLLTAGYRMHRAGKAANTRMFLFLVGALSLTFTAADWWPGLYKWTSHGIGIVVLAVALAWGGIDFYFHVLKHEGWHEHKTARAAMAFGVAGMLTFANWTGIMHGVQGDLHGSGYTQVLSKVTGNGG